MLKVVGSTCGRALNDMIIPLIKMQHLKISQTLFTFAVTEDIVFMFV